MRIRKYGIGAIAESSIRAAFLRRMPCCTEEQTCDQKLPYVNEIGKCGKGAILIVLFKGYVPVT